MSKLKFEEMDAVDQFVLLLTTARLISESGCTGLDDFASMLGRTKLEVWPIFCAEAELDECEPWMGYPGEQTAESIELCRQAADKAFEMGNPITGVYLEMWKDRPCGGP
jgi:hypothetical protein